MRIQESSRRDETESGETYDKNAAQGLELANRIRRRRRRRSRLDLEVEAKLVRLAMSESMTVSQLVKELGLSARAVNFHLKQLGLDRMVLQRRRGKAREKMPSRRAGRASTRVAADQV